MTNEAFARVARIDEISPEQVKVVTVEGREILLCNSKGRLFAVSNICSHANERLACGRIRSGWIACPVHGARFDLETGRAMNPPATRPIQTFTLRVVEDWIEVNPQPEYLRTG